MPLFVFAPKAPFSEHHDFCLSVFTWRKRSLQAELNTWSWFWRPLGVPDMRTISSAKSRKSISTNPGSSWIPCIPCCSTDGAVFSLINKEKSIGLGLRLCLSPAGKSKNSVSLSPILTHDTTDLYIAPGQSIFYSNARYHRFLYSTKSIQKLPRQSILTENVEEWSTLNRIKCFLSIHETRLYITSSFKLAFLKNSV